MKFLVVDDSQTMRRIIRKVLSSCGYEDAVEAGDGEEALSILNQDQDIGFILTDWNMPNMTGIEFVQSVRKDSRFDKVPIIMITTNSAKAEIIQAIGAGVNNYIAKPFTPDVIKMKIDQTLAKMGT